MERERERREKMIACHSCISSGAKTEAEMKNVICQDYSCASIHTHTHTHALHTNPAPGRNRAISPFWVCSHLLEAHHPPSNDLHAARERRSPDLLLIAYRSPPLYQFPVKIIAFSRARPIFRSVIIVDNSCPPLSTASSSPKH